MDQIVTGKGFFTGPEGLDRATQVFLALLALLAGCHGLFGSSLLLLAGAAAVRIIPRWLRKRSGRLGPFLAAWYPVLLFTLCYRYTALLNTHSPFPLLDPWLLEVDRWLFNEPLCDRFARALPQEFVAEVMAFSYFSYYLMIPGLGLICWFRERQRFHEFIRCTGLCFYTFYLIFSIFPSHGPQFYLRSEPIVWPGWVFGPALTHLLQSLEVPTGAFPSSHLGVALIVTVFAFSLSRATGWILSLLLLGLGTATVYGGPHYFIDLPCGLVVGWIFLLLAGPRSRSL